jgi:hypothetical protein
MKNACLDTGVCASYTMFIFVSLRCWPVVKIVYAVHPWNEDGFPWIEEATGACW